MKRHAFFPTTALLGVLALAWSCAPADPADEGDLAEPGDELPVGESQAELTSTQLDHNPGDLNVRWIRRLPLINYVWGSTNPKVEGWPAAGSTVTWQGHIRNRSDFARTVAYRWYLNGVQVSSGSVYIPAHSNGTVNYAWTWSFTRNTVRLVIDPANVIPEVEEGNNGLTVYSNAISVAFYVEQGMYDYFNANQWKLAGVHSVSLEDWAQRQVSRWNTKLGAAIFPLTPGGVTDRIRLDNIIIVPNGSLPLSGGGPATNRPNENDRTVDLQWGFVGSQMPPANPFYSDNTTVSESNPFYYEGSLFHELGHARYLVDTYGFDVHHTTGPDKIYITEGGVPIPGTSYLPFVSGSTMVHAQNNNGLMGGDYSKLDEHSARALNRIAGARATLGNYNAPGNIGVYLNSDLPSQNQVQVLNSAGAPLAGANVKVYRATGTGSTWYGKVYDNTPDYQYTTDASGKLTLPRCPFDADGTVDHTHGIANGVLIVRVQAGTQVGYGFLEVTDFNKEYWRGHTGTGVYTLRVPISGGLPNWAQCNQDSDCQSNWCGCNNGPLPKVCLPSTAYPKTCTTASPWCSANCGGGGWWCANDGACIQNGVPGHNYHCPGNNMAPDRDQACAAGCTIAPTGYPDYCAHTTFCGGGSWCGNDCVGGYSKTLYNFTSGGSLSSVTQCEVGFTNRTCVIAPSGSPDYCN